MMEVEMCLCEIKMLFKLESFRISSYQTPFLILFIAAIHSAVAVKWISTH